MFVIIVLACGTIPYRSVVHMVGDSLPSESTDSTCANTGESYADNPFYGWPVEGGDYAFVTAYYCDPFYYNQFGYIHWGIDLAYPWGTPVVATTESLVTRVEYDHPARGNNIQICANGYCATYMHLSSITLVEGEYIANRVIVGYEGDTGNTTGAHLHYELTDPSGNQIDPRPTMP